ncbi:MAG: alkene reductase [Chthoniobacterales bacterium]|nr:alkene reductase [Chthoniobacterales bacterium]
MSQSLLSTPVRIGAWDLPNRLVMAPLTRCRASEGRVPNALMTEYYVQRSSAGLILSEATAVDPMGVGYPDTPGIWSDAQVEGWKSVTDAVHRAGGRILLQLWHVGRISDPIYLEGKLPVAPSAIRPSGHVSLLRPMKGFETPRALETTEIPGIVAAYRRGAENAQRAGFDGVELHGANGYLLDQFLQDSTNHRTDEYGGSLENRARLMLETVDAAVGVWGADRVGLHLAPACDTHDMGESDPAATFGYIAREAGKRGIAFLCLREGLGAPADATPEEQIAALDAPRLAPLLKREFGGALINNQNITPLQAAELIRRGEAEAIAYGRQFIANPDLPARLARGAALNEPNPASFYHFEHPADGYTDYPKLAV